jgi:copper chaperone CopZ
LEHPCTDCGDSDYHGKFRLVGKRKLKRSSDVQLHFFEVTERKFSFMHLFEPESSRVETFRQEGLKIPARKTVVKEKPLCCSSGTCTAKMIEPIKVEAEKPSCCSSGTCSKSAPVEKPSCCSNGTCSKSTMDTSSVSDTTIAMESDAGKRKIVRSTMYCSGICCSSEVPLVNSALEPLDGVEKIMINVPLRNVIIDHDPSVVTAKILKDILNQNDFGASIRRDGGAKQKQTGQGKSKFYVDKICCASEIPMINSVINPIEGTSAVSINVTTKMVRKQIVVAQGLLP